jgi:hypothetical protein
MMPAPGRGGGAHHVWLRITRGLPFERQSADGFGKRLKPLNMSLCFGIAPSA